MQRISCDQCDLFAVGLINGANVLSTGSHVDSLADEYLYLYFFVCGALYGANVLSSGSHSGEKGGRQVAAENGTKLAGDNKLVARENSTMLIA